MFETLQSSFLLQGMMIYIQELQTEQISRSPYWQQMKPKQSIVDDQFMAYQ
jgi:hypothetical protein